MKKSKLYYMFLTNISFSNNINKEIVTGAVIITCLSGVLYFSDKNKKIPIKIN